MGFFSKLFSRKKPAPQVAQTADIAPELEPALVAYQAERYDEAIVIASPYAEHQADANRLCALAHAGAGRHAEAFPYWLALFEQEPSAHNALQLATTSVMCGEIQRGEAWFQKVGEIAQEAGESMSVTDLTNFLSAFGQSGYLAEALPYVTTMRDVYGSLHITDSTFLYMRGVPFFSVFLEKSLSILRATQSVEEIKTWYEALKGKLDEEGETQLAEWVAQI
jgi:hypothetical protein